MYPIPSNRRLKVLMTVLQSIAVAFLLTVRYLNGPADGLSVIFGFLGTIFMLMAASFYFFGSKYATPSKFAMVATSIFCLAMAVGLANLPLLLAAALMVILIACSLFLWHRGVNAIPEKPEEMPGDTPKE